MAKRVCQYRDYNGNILVAGYPIDDNLEPWFNDMIEQYGLVKLCEMYPYQIIIKDESGEFKPAVDCTYNALVTNGFHMRLAMQNDALIEREGYRLRLADAYPDHDEPVVRDIAPPTADKIIEKEEDGYRIDYEHMPEQVTLKAPEGFHPNKDANGNYMANPKVSSNNWGYWGNNYGYYGSSWGSNPWSYNSYSSIYPYGSSYPF